MRVRLIAILATVLGLLAPASVANAAPPYTLTVDAYSTAVYPAVDGFLDSTEIVGNVDAGGAIERIRGSVVVTIGARAVKSFPLSTTGPFTFIWNGRAGNGTIIPGVATVTVRVEGQVSAGDTLTISAKKLVKLTRTTTQPAWLTGICHDDKVFSDVQAEIRYVEKICSTPRNGAGAILRLTLRGKISAGPIVLEPAPDKSVPSITNDYVPAIVSITAKFGQSGSGGNQFYLCEDTSCTPPTDATMRAFSGSGIYTTTGSSPAPSYPSWRIVVAHGHDLSLTKFTITTTYWVLR